MLQKYRHKIAVLGLAMALAGCALNPGKETSKDPSKDPKYSELYNGEMQVAHEAGQHETTRQEAIANGDEALADGDTDRAMYEYVHALELSGGDVETLNKIGAIHNRLGNYSLAARAYAHSLKLDANNPAAQEGVGLLYLREHRYDDARQHFSAALEGDPLRWKSHNGLGMIADMNGDYESAVAHYRQALDTPPEAEQPDKSLLLNNLGYSLYLSGDWLGAQQHFHKALKYNPGLDRAWQNLGLVYTRKGEYERALDVYRNVMEKPEAYNNMGFLCMINQEYDQAEYFFQKAIKLSPTYYVKAHENLDQMNRLRGKGD
jgi:Flp pilus assembly protein TadD